MLPPWDIDGASGTKHYGPGGIPLPSLPARPDPPRTGTLPAPAPPPDPEARGAG